jgi:glycosyltransferase involved in cell wall biosynthesis
MKLSVEISTFNRKDVLRMVLERLARQTYPHSQFEVVISDDGSTDGTDAVVEQMRSSMPYVIRFFAHQHCGCGGTHNIGIQQAKGDIVLMLADDVLPSSRLIEEHMKTHEQEPEDCAVVMGRLAQSPLLPQTVFQNSWNSILTRHFANSTTEQYDYTNFWVSNISFKKKFMLNGGMFRDWPAGSHEDLELGYRLQQKGMKLIFNPNALGYHHDTETVESMSARAHLLGYNWHLFEEQTPTLWVRKRSGHVRLSDGLGAYFKCLLKGGLQTVFANRFWVSCVYVPLIKQAEAMPSLTFLAPWLTDRLASYHFRKGLADYKKDSRKSGATP